MNRTIERTLQILNYVGESDGVTLKEITNYMMIPKSSVFDIVQSLLELKLLEQHRLNDRKYILGIAAYSLGSKYTKNRSLFEVAAPYLNSLADKLKRTSFMGTLDGTDIIYIYKYAGDGAKLATCSVGSKHPAYATALGKAYLAYLPDKERIAIVDKINFIQKTNNTIKNKQDLIENLKLVKKRGYSIDCKENEDLMICYGAPIFDSTSNIVAAISFSDVRNNDYSDEEIGGFVRECALNISRDLGYLETQYWDK